MRFIALALILSILPACDDKPPRTGGAAPAAAKPQAPPPGIAAPAPAAPKRLYWTQELVQAEIKYHNPAYEGNGEAQINEGQPAAIMLRGAKISSLGFLDKMREVMALDLGDTAVTDLRPLKGLPLIELYLENTQVRDLGPLRGMRLQKLYLSGSPIGDLSALDGMPLEELNAVSILATDLTPLARCPLRMLWLTSTPVENISPLKTVPLVSLTLHRTKVRDLSPLSGTALQRLHVAETPVEDLSPLKGMSLTRLVFTPANIKAGLDAARALPLQEIGTRFDDEGKDLAPPAVFWEAHDAAKNAPTK